MKLLRILAKIVLALVLLAGIGLAWAWWKTDSGLARHIALPDANLDIRGDAAQLERGRHLAVTRGCTDCHGEDLGGRVLIDSDAFARIVPTNLTSAGVGSHYDANALERAIRHGVAFDGTPLVFMPVQDFIGLSDEDTAALIAYLQSVPAVETRQPPTRLGPIARVLYATGKLPLLPALAIDHSRGGPAKTPKAAVTVEYGAYVAQSCIGCHGADYAGGPIPGVPPSIPPARNLTPTALSSWSDADFVRAMREGKRPDGSDIHPFMPWKAYATMSDIELAATFAFLRTLPPKPDAAR